MSMKNLDVLWDKIDTPKKGDGGCWNWIGDTNEFGFGLLNINDEIWLPHKYVGFYLKGSPTKDHPVSQVCRNRKCCNPSHLVIGFIDDDPYCYLGRVKKVYGPYRRKDQRSHVVIVLSDGSKITRSYPKFIIECEYGIELDPIGETIDHVNRDFFNNDKDNIQILTRAENAKKSALRREPVFSKCVYCDTVFELTRNQISNLKRFPDKAGPFCSRTCSGKYGTDIQNNKPKVIDKPMIDVKYYRLDD